MDGLVAIVWNLITETNGAPDVVWAAVCEHIRTDPGILLDAWAEPTDLGSDAKPPVKEQVTQARALVNDVLHAIGDAAGNRWHDLGSVAGGLVVLVARETAEYKRGEGLRPARLVGAGARAAAGSEAHDAFNRACHLVLGQGRPAAARVPAQQEVQNDLEVDTVRGARPARPRSYCAHLPGWAASAAVEAELKAFVKDKIAPYKYRSSASSCGSNGTRGILSRPCAGRVA